MGNFNGLAQENEISVTGTVTDPNGAPIPGINIIEQGTSNGVVTDFEGEYTITVPPDAVLVYSYLGYTTVEMPVDGQTEINITMETSTAALAEVVVVGYGTKKKVDLTGAVSVVNIESMTKQPSAQVSEQLQGQVSGLTVVSSGQPGQAPQVQIRGINTFGNNTPLYVVDGVPTQNITAINPNDIASMQVLKDAGSASIYGARAANGVIIITTKEGSGELSISYNGYYGIQTVPSGNVYDLLSPQEYADLRWIAMENTNPGEPIIDRQFGSGAEPVLPYYILPGGAAQGEVDESTYFVDPYYTDASAVGGFNQIIKANKEGTNWFQEIFSPAPIQSHNISISRGGEKGDVFFSMNYFNQEGTLINTYFERYTARINSTFNFSDNFRIGENLAVSIADDNRVAVIGENPINMSYRIQPIIPVYDIMGNFAGTQAPSLGNAYNPVAVLERNRNNLSRTSNIFGNVFAELDFLEVFTARTTFGGTFFNTNAHAFTYPTYERGENSTINQLSETAATGYNWTWSTVLQYDQTFGDAHELSVMVGTEAYHNQYKEMVAVSQGFYSFDPDYVSLSNGAGTQTNSGFYTENALFSFFGRFDYTYDDRYLLGATIRRDASSKFAEPRYGWFPAVSAGWRIGEEAFMDNVDWIDQLKLRGGYGVMGNEMNVDPANRFTSYGSSRFSSYYPIAGSNSELVEGFMKSRIGNPDASWEKNINANIGINAAFFDSRLQITADYYRKDVVDLLFNPELTGTAGVATVPYVNIAEMTNNGFDFSATGIMDLSSDLILNTTLTFTTYNNEIMHITDGVPYFDLEGRRFNGSTLVRNAVGHSVGQFYGYQIIGFWDDMDEINAANTSARAVAENPNAVYQTDLGIGKFRYADVDGDGIITADDRTFLGNPNPDFTVGLNIALNYKNFDFSMFLYAKYGNDIWNQVKWWHDFYSSFDGAKSHTALYDSWTPTNHNATAPIQVTGGSFSTANVPNSYFVEDGSYLRAKNVQLGYSLSDNVLSAIGLDRFRIYVQASNLFTITNYSGVDPELTGTSSVAFGIDEGAYPTPRQFILGINMSL